MICIVCEVTGYNPTDSENLLKLNDWDIKKVIENREIK